MNLNALSMSPDPVYSNLNAFASIVGALALVIIAYFVYRYQTERLEVTRQISKEFGPFFEVYKKAVFTDGWLFVDLITAEDVRHIAKEEGVAALTVLDEMRIATIIRRNFNMVEGLNYATIAAAITQWKNEKTVNDSLTAAQGDNGDL